MVAIKKRTWGTGDGAGEAYRVSYYVNGKRQRKQFKTKKAAERFARKTGNEIDEGTHIAERSSTDVRNAASIWLGVCEGDGLEQTSLDQYRQHINLHINPFIGDTKLTKLTVPAIRNFEDKLRAAGRSRSMVKYVVRTLASILDEAQERGLIHRNTARDGSKRRKRKGAKSSKRGKQLRVGVDIPTPEEIKLILANAESPKERALLAAACFCGPRASELRGLPWDEGVDFRHGELHIVQRADRYNKLGPPKTDASQRTIPMPQVVMAALEEWKLSCPKGALGLVFPNADGKVDYLIFVVQKLLWPAEIAAGLTKTVSGKNGKDIIRPKYTGLHALRHFFASWCINEKKSGGRELPAKRVQTYMGHSDIAVTMDTYGHLFPRGDDAAEMDAAVKALMAG